MQKKSTERTMLVTIHHIKYKIIILLLHTILWTTTLKLKATSTPFDKLDQIKPFVANIKTTMNQMAHQLNQECFYY